jgi:hypothetical protein
VVRGLAWLECQWTVRGLDRDRQADYCDKPHRTAAPTVAKKRQVAELARVHDGTYGSTSRRLSIVLYGGDRSAACDALKWKGRFRGKNAEWYLRRLPWWS